MPAKNGNSNCCASKPSGVGSTYQRGQIIQTNWGRNNHRNGIIQYSIAKLSESDNVGIFEQNENIFQYACYATDCVGANGDNWAGDPSGTPFNGVKCNVNVQIPNWLDDGEYTFQWRWYSGGDSFGIHNLGLIDFVTCHDFKISGGDKKEKPKCPLFIGGDVVNQNLNTCEYFKDNVINTCTDDRNCFSWYARAPPQNVIDCPSNIITLQDSINNNFQGRELPLFVGATTNPNPNPNPGLTARIPVLKLQNQSPSPNINPIKKTCICDNDINKYCKI
jgi:hypothetical protein